LAEVESVLFELPVAFWDYLTRGEGPDPAEWDFRPDRPAHVNAKVVATDPTGINRLRQ
jgi:hypothetical protein